MIMRNSFLIISIIFSIYLFSCKREEKLFTEVNSNHSNIHFNNRIEEDEKNNIYNFMNIYTGGGVGVGDINNDGLVDVFFAGNLVDNKLFLNKGDFKFEDISEKAGISGDRWCTGVTMVDINQDGWLDIYVSVSGNPENKSTANLLYINQKNNTFKEQAHEYGIADEVQAIQSAFFDYDLDGDLDLFIISNPVDYSLSSVNVIRSRKLNGEANSTDRLYRNNGDNTFTDVSQEAGILIEGYSLGLGINDINNDGWPDIYISNDFLTNDILYKNNGDGTFTDASHSWLKHTSFAGMGNDLADINNDGFTDIMVVDMLPEDNYRQKTIIPAASYDKFSLMLREGYQAQYTRNTLQLNNGNNSFSEIGFLSGISSTDWSWSVLLADYDNDGKKDVFITNGFRRDLGDLDYIHFQQRNQKLFGTQETKLQDKLNAIKELPSASIPNYIFQNQGNLKFSDKSSEWMDSKESLSNGAAYADLDNDGDLDLVINNINSEASILRNNSTKGHFINFKLKGDEKNRDGIGTKIKIIVDGEIQSYQHYLSRGYQSSVDSKIHFGIGKNTKVDTVLITWPDGKNELMTNVKADTLIESDYKNALVSQKLKREKSLPFAFHEISDSIGISFLHKENNYVDFKEQPLLPVMHSKLGPKIAVGDVNGDGLDDFYIGGASGYSGSFFIQNSNKHFTEKKLDFDIDQEDIDVLLFDADQDKDLDLYVVSGGASYPKGSSEYQDRLYLNDGNGNFTKDITALPSMPTSGGVVKAADYDADGDLDLFVGGRITPGTYPMPPQSYILRNDTGHFENVTHEVNPNIEKAGMVSSAMWNDFNGDGKIDLIMAGEFMQIRFFKNTGKTFEEVTAASGLSNTYGWWNNLAEGDFDNDGDLDFIAGNWGINTKYKASIEEPLCIYAKDYDNNGRIDPVMCYYINGKNYPAHSRDLLISQINPIRNRFPTYKDYANVTFEKAFLTEELEDAYVVKSQTFFSSYFENLGDGKFKTHKLPMRNQMGPINGIKVIDVNKDKKLDLLFVGNNYSGDASWGNQDAMIGALLLGEGKGSFKNILSIDSGFYIDSDARDIQTLNDGNLILVSSNSGKLKVFTLKENNNE